MPPTPGGRLTSHHHGGVGRHLPVPVRGHGRVGCCIVEVCPWREKARQCPKRTVGLLRKPVTQTQTPAFFESHLCDLDPLFMSDLFKNNASPILGTRY